MFGKSYEALALEQIARAIEFVGSRIGRVADELKRFNDRQNMPTQAIYPVVHREEFIQMGTKTVHVLIPRLVLPALPTPNDIAKREVRVAQFDGSVLTFTADGAGDATIEEAGKWEPNKAYSVICNTVDTNGNIGPDTETVMQLADTTNSFTQDGLVASAVREEFVDVEVPDEGPTEEVPPAEGESQE